MSENKIGSGIELEGFMNFNGTVPEHYDKHVKQSIPGYERAMQKIGFASQFFVPVHNARILDIGSGTGRALTEIITNNYGKDISIQAADQSPEMIQFLRTKWKDSQKWVRHFEISNIDIYNFHFQKNNYHLVTAALVFQFFPEGEREYLISRIFDSLMKSGAFIWYEKCNEKYPKSGDITKQYMNTFKINSGLSAEEILKKDAALRGVMTPVTFEENYKFLKKHGFSEITILDKDTGFTLFLAIK